MHVGLGQRHNFEVFLLTLDIKSPQTLLNCGSFIQRGAIVCLCWCSIATVNLIVAIHRMTSHSQQTFPCITVFPDFVSFPTPKTLTIIFSAVLNFYSQSFMILFNFCMLREYFYHFVE